MPTPQEREEALFDRALELPAGERVAWLERECAGDATLLARLKALLAATEQSDELLAPPVAATQAIARNVVGELSDATGQTIGGRYQLLEKLGEGGFGVVYVAEQSEPVRRRVALKLIKLGMDTKAVVARFEAERQTLAIMDHPGIAKVLDAGATEQGRPYFVMELVQGMRITDFCDQNKLSTRERLDLFIKVCQAIQHAHQKGIIHRDIKPSNILVQFHDGVALPKVIDFGIAKATAGRLTDATIQTQLHQFMGTPAYISPEQAEMSGRDIDTRSDIYSLGVVLYELLTGSTPFNAEELMNSGIGGLRKIICETEPPHPSTMVARRGSGQTTGTGSGRAVESPRLLQGDLDCIVMKCLEKDRARRYETANGLAADLQRHLNNEPVAARPPSVGYRFQKAVRRHKLAFAAASMVFAALVAGLSASLTQAARAKRAEKLAGQRLVESEKARTRAETAEREAVQTAAAERAARTEAEAVAALVTGVFRSPNPTRDGRTVTVAETLDLAARKLDLDAGIQPFRRAALEEAMAGTYDALGLYREAAALWENVRDIYRTQSGNEHTNTLAAMHNLANSYFLAGRRNEAVALQEEVLQRRRTVLGPRHNDTLQTMLSLSLSYHNLGRYEDALKLREEVLAARRQMYGPEDYETLWALKALAQSYHAAGRVDEALKMREQLLEVRRRLPNPEHPQTLGAISDLSQSYFAVGRFEEALKLREEVLPILRKVRGPDHPDTVRASQALFESYNAAGRLKDTLPMLSDAFVRNPGNTVGAIKLAALQVWFGQGTNYAATCRKMLDWGANGRTPVASENIARLVSLRPYPNPRMGEDALRLARIAVQPQEGKPPAALFSLTLGMVEYRRGQYADAEAALLDAVTRGRENLRVVATASFYRAMCAYQQGNETASRQRFAEGEKKMTPLPHNEQNPLADPNTTHDDIIMWLAYKEAAALLKVGQAASR